MTTYNIASYQCVQHTHRPGIVSSINLYDDSNIYRGSLYFYPDGVYLSGASEDTSAGRIFLQFPVSRFVSTVDILRNESPIRLVYNTPTSAYLATGREPTGEEETGTS